MGMSSESIGDHKISVLNITGPHIATSECHIVLALASRCLIVRVLVTVLVYKPLAMMHCHYNTLGYLLVKNE